MVNRREEIELGAASFVEETLKELARCRGYSRHNASLPFAFSPKVSHREVKFAATQLNQKFVASSACVHRGNIRPSLPPVRMPTEVR
jgi:hypothetical protein